MNDPQAGARKFCRVCARHVQARYGETKAKKVHCIKREL